MDNFLTPELMRMLERLVVVLGGVLSVYLGYRLFLDVKLKVHGEGTLKTAWVEVGVSRVGPGVFFALFGVAVLGFSLASPISTNHEPARSISWQYSMPTASGSGMADGYEISVENYKKLQELIANLPEADREKANRLFAQRRVQPNCYGYSPFPPLPTLHSPTPGERVDGYGFIPFRQNAL